MEKKQPNQCPSCGKLLQEDFNVCPYCGEPVKITCAKCGKILAEEYNNCPYCGAKVKRKVNQTGDNNSPTDFKQSAASVLTMAGAFLQKVGRTIKTIALKTFDHVKKATQKALEWLRSIDWSRSKEFFKSAGSNLAAFVNKAIPPGKLKEIFQSFGGKLAAFTHKAVPWLKQIFVKSITFVKKVFLRLRDSLANILEKKLSPETAQKTALGIIASVCLLCLLIFVSLIFSKPAPTPNKPLAEQSPTAVSQPVVDPAEQKWLVMIYADADDEILENDLYFDLNEAESAGSTDRVQIVAQLDRFAGGFSEDGDWTGTRRYFVTQDDDLNVIHSDLAVDLGEVDMGSTDTLIDFATWAIRTYPADRYVLIMSDHGSGWTGGWYDNTPENPSGNFIALNKLDTALGEIIAQTGIGKFEVIGMDACLMGMLEVYNSLEPYARYAVASEEVEPAMGWAYDYFLTQLTDHPEMESAQFAQAIIDGYIQKDLRIQDSAAYQQLLTVYNLPENVDKELFSNKMSERVTLSAVDLALLPAFNEKFNQVLLALKESDQGMVAEARSYAQAFFNIFDDGMPSPFIDLKNFLNIIAENNISEALKNAISETESTYDNMVISEVHGSDFPGASGISIYFPISQHYWEGGLYSQEWYPVITERFSQSSLWDDYLAYHYSGQDFGQGIPPIESRTVAPGYSEITISKPVITPGTVSTNNPNLNIQADISGDRIAYIYLVSMYRVENRLLFYQFDYILGDDNIDVNGVIFPFYKRDNGVKHVDLDFEISASGVQDGKTFAFAVVEPETYGTTPKESIYSVKGFYISAETGEEVSARMYFYNDGDNEMRNIVGYFGSEEHGAAPAEITPKKGDQFQFLDTWWVVDENGNVTDYLNEGNSLTFGDQPFQQSYASQFIYPGEYYIGIGVEDMDGNSTISFSPVVVE